VIPLPEITPKRLAIKLKLKAEKMIKRQHPWVFESSIVKLSKTGNPGDLAVIFEDRKNSFLACGLYDPYSPIRIKIIQFEKGETINEAWFAKKIGIAFSLRTNLLATDTTSYRLLNGENDGFPGFIADVYDRVLVVKLYSHIWLPYLKYILAHAISITGCETTVLRLSRRLQTKGELYGLYDGQLLDGTLEDDVVIFKEHGVLFSANVIHGHKTGYFLDHRNNRKKVGMLSKNKKVLDVFSYAGGFSVHALANGAKEVTSIDISAKALHMAKQNAALNTPKGIHITRTVDAFEGLQDLIRRNENFDVVVIDPPSFAKRESEIARAIKSYERLAKLAVKLVKKRGILVLASCSSRVDAATFFKVSENSMSQLGYAFDVIEKTYHDIDHPISFPEGAYLKCGYYRIH
jgi:23S rRNA (cytosine1962-C5)-methyltransferase